VHILDPCVGERLTESGLRVSRRREIGSCRTSMTLSTPDSRSRSAKSVFSRKRS
jgi:hypothetical protein